MRRFILLTAITFVVLSFLGFSVLRTLHAQGEGQITVGAGDLLDSSPMAQLGLQLVSVGGKVTQVSPNSATVRDKYGHDHRILFAQNVTYLEGTTHVPASAIEIGAHISTQAVDLHSGAYGAFKAVHIMPHVMDIGGEITGIHDGLTITDRHGAASFVQILPHASITMQGQPLRAPLALHMRVLARAYSNPMVLGVFLSANIRVLGVPSTTRVGGIVASIDGQRNLVSLYSKATNVTYRVEMLPSTKILLAAYPAGVPDLVLGDHVTVTGKPDVVNAATGPKPLQAKILRISSPTFGGTITGITKAASGSMMLAVHTRLGQVLQILAPGRVLVYSVIGGIQQNGRIFDLFVGEHIATKGLRTGKYAQTAAAIHVYPRLHTVGGTAASVLPGVYRMLGADGRQYIIHTTASTTYTLNGKLAAATAIKPGQHLRVRGFDALLSQERGFPTMIASHISIIVSTSRAKTKPVVKPKHTAHPQAPAARVGGIITDINRARGLVTLYSKAGTLTYTVEVLPSTKIQLSTYTAGLPDMDLGDHLTVTGTPDVVNAALGPRPVRAAVITMDSLAFGGVISAIKPMAGGSIVISLPTHTGHLLQIAAPAGTLVYSVIGSAQQTANVRDLLIGERIFARGTRTGKFSETASAIHVYPRQHTVDGTVASVQLGIYRLLSTAGKQLCVQVTAKTIYTLNGKAATNSAIRAGEHIRVRGYDALQDAQPGLPTIIAAHVSITVRAPHAAMTGSATPAPTPPAHPAAPQLGSHAGPDAVTPPQHHGQE